MSDKKDRISVTIDPHLTAYAEHLVETGKASSVSAVVNEAMQEKVERDRTLRRVWDAAVAKSDPVKGARLAAHVDRQLANL
jgi:Arc/MetJ-type ribon-helix-helix transcriptional regulator